MKALVSKVIGNDNGNSNFLGFTSINDFLESLLRVKAWVINMFGAISAITTTFITGYMWDSAEAVYTLWAIMGVDWFTGVGKSIKKKEFLSYRFFRMPIYYVATSLIISLTWWMGKGNVIFIPLPAIAMGGFYGVYFSSFLENLAELEWLPKPAIQFLKKFGLKVIINKYLSKDLNDEDKSN
jgi:hypothetical protein